MFKKILKSVLATAFVSTSFSAAHGATLEERIAELEANRSLNVFEFSGILETRYDSIATKQTVGTPLIDDKTNYLRMKVSLDADANVSDKIKFYSRLTATKFMNGTSQGTYSTVVPGDLIAGRDYRGGSQSYFERAYADITVLKDANSSTVFSMGRMPTVDGPPVHFSTGRERQGTYAALGYDSIFDGFAFSYNRSLEQNRGFAARLAYTPFVAYSLGSATVPAFETRPSWAGSGGNNITDLFSFMLEWDQKNMGWANSLNIIWQSYASGKSSVDGTLLGGSGSTGSKFAGHAIVATVDEIGGTGWDVALSATETEIYNEGQITTGSGNIYGFGADSYEDKVRGMIYVVDVRYGFGNSGFLGAEYVNGDKRSFSPIFVTDDLTSFYKTKGNAYQVYGIYKPMPEFAMALGYMRQEAKYSATAVGAIQDSDRKNDTVYADLRLDF